MGQLLLQLACAVGGLPSPSLDFAHAHYSPEFVRLLMLLLGVADGGGFSWRAVSALLGERLLLDMDTLAIFNEQLVSRCPSLPSRHRWLASSYTVIIVVSREALSCWHCHLLMPRVCCIPMFCFPKSIPKCLYPFLFMPLPPPTHTHTPHPVGCVDSRDGERPSVPAREQAGVCDGPAIIGRGRRIRRHGELLPAAAVPRFCVPPGRAGRGEGH